MKITFLGTGTSQGVPVIACHCPVCQSNDPKDKRLRTSILVSFDGHQFVVDSGPDFRQQMLREDVQNLDAVVFTHEHKDHVAGLDDVRAFNYKAKAPMKIWASERVEAGLRKEFHYVFGDHKYPGVPQLELNRIDGSPFTLFDKKIIPIQVMHHQLPVYGFRIDQFTYITDANYISPREMDKIRGTEVLVLNALRKEKHLSHFNLKEALEIVEEIKPKKAYFTHLSHLMGRHDEVSSWVPPNVEIAYDGLSFEL